MNLQQLRYLIALADVGTMTGAAASLRVSQPALTRALHGLQAELGVVLMVRAGRNVELTEDGHRVLEVARRVIHDVDSLGALGDSVARLCSTPTQARELCAGAIARLAQLAPDMRVALDTEDSAAAVVRTVAGGRAEIGVCELPVEGPVVAERLGEQDLRLVHPPGWELPDPLPFRDLDGMKLIAPSRDDRRFAQLTEVLEAAGVRPDFAVATDRRDLLVPLVLDGVGATLAWPATAREALRQGAGVVSVVPTVTRSVGLVHRPGPLSARGRELRAALVAEAAAGARA